MMISEERVQLNEKKLTRYMNKLINALIMYMYNSYQFYMFLVLNRYTIHLWMIVRCKKKKYKKHLGIQKMIH